MAKTQPRAGRNQWSALRRYLWIFRNFVSIKSKTFRRIVYAIAQLVETNLFRVSPFVVRFKHGVMCAAHHQHQP